MKFLPAGLAEARKEWADPRIRFSPVSAPLLKAPLPSQQSSAASLGTTDGIQVGAAATEWCLEVPPGLAVLVQGIPGALGVPLAGPSPGMQLSGEQGWDLPG